MDQRWGNFKIAMDGLSSSQEYGIIGFEFLNVLTHSQMCQRPNLLSRKVPTWASAHVVFHFDVRWTTERVWRRRSTMFWSPWSVAAQNKTGRWVCWKIRKIHGNSQKNVCKWCCMGKMTINRQVVGIVIFRQDYKWFQALMPLPSTLERWQLDVSYAYFWVTPHVSSGNRTWQLENPI